MKKTFFSLVLLYSFSVSFSASSPEFMDVVGEKLKIVAQDEEVKRAVENVRIAAMQLAHVSFKKYIELASPEEKQIMLPVVALSQDVLEDVMPSLRGGSLTTLDEEQQIKLGQKIMVLQQMLQLAGMKLAEYMQENYSKTSTTKRGSRTVITVEPDLKKLAPFYMPVLEGVQSTLEQVKQDLIA